VPVNSRGPIPDERNIEEQYVFEHTGNIYRIIGFGESGLVKSLLGFDYIQRLIAAPRQPIAMLELAGSATDPRIVTDQRTRQPVLDKEAKDRLSREYAELKAELERAQDNNDLGETERLQTELAALEEQMRAATGIRGRPRDLNNPLDTLRANIHGALKRAYELLRKSAPPMAKLAEHFEASISSESGCFIYRPAAQEITWQTALPASSENVVRRATK
jgi:hypothetical protein